MNFARKRKSRKEVFCFEFFYLSSVKKTVILSLFFFRLLCLSFIALRFYPVHCVFRRKKRRRKREKGEKRLAAAAAAVSTDGNLRLRFCVGGVAFLFCF